jgi:hypothetical protein
MHLISDTSLERLGDNLTAEMRPGRGLTHDGSHDEDDVPF